MNKVQEATTRKFFIAGLGCICDDSSNRDSPYFEMWITDYPPPTKKLKKLQDKASPLRWIEIKNCIIYPGHGEGSAILGEREYKLSYAWKGLSAWDISNGDGDWNSVLSWTTRWKLPEKSKRTKIDIADFIDQIIVDEGYVDSKKVYISRAEWLLKHYGIKDNTLHGYRRALQREAKKFKQELKDPKSIWGGDVDPDILKMMKQHHTPKSIEKRVKTLKGTRKIDVTPRRPVTPKRLETWM